MIEENKKKRKLKKFKKKTTYLLIVIDILAISCFFLVYGPFGYFRNLFVNTALKTMNHKYYAYILYSEKTVEDIKNSNYFVKLNETTNTDDVVIDTKEKDQYANEYEKQILTRDKGNNDYKLINIKVGSANAYLVAIYDPSKVHLIAKEKLGTQYGERVITMCQRNHGLVCINGGAFVDKGYGSGIPNGYVVKDGKIIWSAGYNAKAELIGFTYDNKLLLTTDSAENAIKNKNLKDALQFGPFLIVNGKPLEIVGDPWGKAPRVAIAQRKDGVVLFLVVDGENYVFGASLKNLVDTLQKYGAYNAANLDGGTSATLIVNNKLTNNPAGGAKSTDGRYVITGWGLLPN